MTKKKEVARKKQNKQTKKQVVEIREGEHQKQAHKEKPYLNNNSIKISFNSVKLQKKKGGGPADHVPMVNVFQIHKLCNH